ncbi:hypothetical protein PROFUN_13732 [Planoprotostelium fungivorum]|uniref:Uncharacterized protein n=1 Tax=Planoprotostelium fungivorum TaxID=1890364 RepID=A0A2P6MX03_9EUKA|nr:hypothetical protein PROFUN_13732 [Planoprotostelium fungivorum]
MSLGFICRFSRRNGISAWSWLFETWFILISSCGLLAQDYVLLPRLASSLEANRYLILPQRVILAIFVTADAVTVCSQLAGTALTITFGDLVPIGVKIVISGLWVQLVFFSAFLTTFIMFGARVYVSSCILHPDHFVVATGKRTRMNLGINDHKLFIWLFAGNSKLAHSEMSRELKEAREDSNRIQGMIEEKDEEVEKLCDFVWLPYCLQSKYIIDKHTTLPLED